MNTSITREVFTSPVSFLAFGFGVGLIPFIPGTCGTLIAIPFYLLLQFLPWQLYLAFVLGAFIFGIWLCDVSEKIIGIKDYSGIVWDEIVGYWLTMFLAPPRWEWILLGFVLFRLFDILKPWPINWLNQKVVGGFGIMLDDLMAALFSFILLQVVILSITPL